MRHLLLTLMLLVAVQVLKAVPTDEVYFHHYNTVEALNKVNILTITQDVDGFMWLGSDQGLMRFDGTSVRVYNRQHHPDLPSNQIRTIYTSKSGDMWLVTGSCVVKFNPHTERFTPISLSCGGRKLTSIGMTQLTHNGRLVFTSAQGLFSLDTLSHKVVQINTRIDRDNKLRVFSFYQDANGTLWMGCPNAGIWRYDNNHKKPVRVGNYEHTPLIVREYSADSIIIGAINRGVTIMSKHTGESRRVHIPGVAGDNIFVTNFCRVSDDEIWIASKSGVYRLCNGCVVEALKHSADDPLSLSYDDVQDIFQDSRGAIWVSTTWGGLDYFSPCASYIRKYYACQRYQGFSGSHVTAIIEGLEGDLWIGTDDAGLNHRLSDGTFQRGLPTLPTNRVTDLLLQGQRLWIATFSGGLFLYDTVSSQMRRYYKDGARGCITNNEDNSLLIDHKGVLWVGTTTELFRRNADDTFTSISGIRGWINNIVEDRQNCLWLATGNGLLHYNPTSGKVTHYQHNPADSTSVSVGSLHQLHLTDCYLWIGSEENGLDMMDLTTHRVHHITTAQGLPSNRVCRILESQDGMLWVSTTSGLAKIEVTTGRVVQTWHNNYWLSNSVFYGGAGVASHSGELFFGCVNGFISFFPNRIERSETQFHPVVTEVLAVGPDDAQPLIHDGHVALSPRQNTFSLRFSAMDYDHENGGEYQYRLEGVDHSWLDCVGAPVASYNNLAPGEYVLHVRYSTDGMNWSPDTASLTIRVAAPWWRTWWAFLVYGLLVIAAVWFAFRRFRHRQEERIALQRSRWEQQQRDEKIRARINFFTNVAHEIRTPLSLIKASVEQMEQTPLDRNGRGILYRNVDRLTTLVNQLLEFRRVESGQVTLSPKAVDLCQTLRVTIDSFSSRLRQSDISLTTHFPADQQLVLADEEALNCIITNLLSNAVKYCHHTIDIATHVESQQMLLTISNDGEPIPVEIRADLFAPFVKGSKGDDSTGLGLSLAYLMVTRMNGTIRFNSDDQRTTFTLALPKAAIADSPLQRTPALTPDLSDNGRPAILVAEDNDDMRHFLSDKLSASYTVVTAHDGQEAWTMLQTTDVHAIISDIMMPNWDGYTLLQKVKQTLLTCHIPVILLTAKTTEPDHIQGYNIGADAYIDKPFSVARLEAQLASLLHNRMLLQKRLLQLSPADNTPSLDCVPSTNDLDREFCQRLNEYIKVNLSEEGFNIDALANEMNMSRSNFHRKMKSLFALTPGEYIQIVRLDTAAQLLLTGKYLVLEVASMVGISSPAHFTRSFQKRFGVPPTKYTGQHPNP